MSPHAIDIMCSLIKLPLRPMTLTDTQTPWTKFFQEWMKIESQIVDEEKCLFILSEIVESARETQHCKNHKKFKNDVVGAIDSVAKYVIIRYIDWTKLFEGLLEVVLVWEGILHEIMEKIENEKKGLYKLLPFSPRGFIADIHRHFPDHYDYKHDTPIEIIDVDNKRMTKVLLSELKVDIDSWNEDSIQGKESTLVSILTSNSGVESRDK